MRLEVDDATSNRVLNLLVRELEITEQEVYRGPAPLDLAGLWPIAELDRPDLQYPGFVPETHRALRGGEGTTSDVFTALRAGDVLLHHPYDSFATSVQSFIEQAATDPRVQAIKLTLYRTSGESPIVDALVEAAESGKQVLVVVEIKARFDEQANIRWARKLEQAGCHVVYGLVGLKTHCKLALVVRSEDDGRMLRRYVHVGTGNYHPKTARVYEDLGLLTADPEIGADVADLFNHLSGYTRHRDYDTLLVAPEALRAGLLDLIGREARRARKGKSAGISIKVNNLVDETIIDALYDASSAGVPIDLLVRGMCSIRPGVPGLSENIRVRSLLGRFLEHSRIFRFDSGGERTIWIGSADIMDRNLDRRVEALVRVRRPGRPARDRRPARVRLVRPGRPLDPAVRRQLEAIGARPRDGRLSAGDHRPAARGCGEQRRRRDRLTARERNGGDRGCRRSRLAADRREPASDRGGAGAPAQVRRLVAAQGQARTRRAPAARRRLREVEEETGARAVRRAAARPARATPWTDGPSGCSTGHCAGRAASSARTTRSTRSTGCRSRRPATGSSPTATASSWSEFLPRPATYARLRRRTPCASRKPVGVEGPRRRPAARRGRPSPGGGHRGPAGGLRRVAGLLLGRTALPRTRSSRSRPLPG